MTRSTVLLRAREAVFGRRGLLRAATALGFAALGVFPAARRAYADGYDIWDGECPSYAEDHDCSPGCGPSAIFGDACETSGPNLGFHKDDGITWTLRPNQCYSGTYDGWIWRYEGACGTCSCHVERRCHDGYRNTGSGWVRSICRWNTACGCRAPVSWPTLRQGDVGDTVRTAQLLLTHHGFAGAADGNFTASTTRQVEAFQTSVGLADDGVIGPQTWTALAVTVRRGDRNDAVRAVQVQAAAHGYELALDGVFGPDTEGAITDFQRQNDLAVDGVAGPETWRTLTGAAL